MNIVPQFLRRKIEHRPALLKIVDNIGWLFFDKVLRMGVGLLVGVWVARYLGPTQFGLYSFATAFVGMFGAVAGLGLQSIVVRDLVRHPENKSETLGTAAALQLAGGLVAYGLLMGTIFWLRPDDDLAQVLVALLGSVLLFKSSEIAATWFESQVQSKYTVWVQNGCFLVFAAIKIALILQGSPLIAFAWAAVGEALFVALLLFLALGMNGQRLNQLRLSLARARTLLQDSWPLLMSGIAIMIYMKIDQIMLGQIVGDDAVGIYSAAVRISEVWYFIPMVIVASTFPSILEAKKHSERQYYQRLQQLYDLMVLISIGIALPMTFLSTPLVTALFGQEFASAGPVLGIHIWASVFVFLGVASSKWFVVENRQILSFQRTALGAAVNIVFNFLLIPKFGAIGAAVATVVAQVTAAWLVDALQPITRKMFFMKMSSMNPLRLKIYLK
jgi:PST family polysaccharide transporter